MIKYGIFTSASEVWFHLHPLESPPHLYYYRVADCRAFIEAESPLKVPAKSKDGRITALGFIVSKKESLVARRVLAQSRVGSNESWQVLTDFESGQRGADIVVEALRQGIFPELGTEVRITNSKFDQYRSIDIFINGVPAEIKTERIVSKNLFVQDEEGGHNPFLLADGTTREVELTPFTPDPGFVGYTEEGHFVHYCHCGKYAAYGYGVKLLQGQLGTWYCRDHRPVA